MSVEVQTPHFLQVEELIIYFRMKKKNDGTGKIEQSPNNSACFEKLNKEQIA